MKYLCVIPARCGSKGIPFKNIVDLCGKPLISYTIDIALRLKAEGLLDTIIVSTDCIEIANISKSLGANVPFLRPKEISGDKARSADLALHAVDHFDSKNIKFDTIIILQPTSPLRIYEDCLKSIKIFNTNQENSLISTYKEETINELIMYYKENNRAIPYKRDHSKGITRQEHGEVYIRNGAIYITKVDYLKKEKNIISNTPLIYVMSKERSINLDTPEDLETIRKLKCK